MAGLVEGAGLITAEEATADRGIEILATAAAPTFRKHCIIVMKISG